MVQLDLHNMMKKMRRVDSNFNKTKHNKTSTSHFTIQLITKNQTLIVTAILNNLLNQKNTESVSIQAV